MLLFAYVLMRQAGRIAASGGFKSVSQSRKCRSYATHLLCCCLLAVAVMLPRLRCRACMRAAHIIAYGSDAWLHGLTCILTCLLDMHPHMRRLRACLDGLWSKRTRPCSKTLRKDALALLLSCSLALLLSCSPALSRSASRHADASIPEALPLALHMRAESSLYQDMAGSMGCKVWTVLTLLTHAKCCCVCSLVLFARTLLTHATMRLVFVRSYYSLVRVSRRPRWLWTLAHGSHGSRRWRVALMALDAGAWLSWLWTLY